MYNMKELLLSKQFGFHFDFLLIVVGGSRNANFFNAIKSKIFELDLL